MVTSNYNVEVKNMKIREVTRFKMESFKNLPFLNAALKSFRGEDHDVKEDIEEMREEQTQLEAEPPWTMKQLLKARRLRFPLILLCALQMGQQLSGINVVSSTNAFCYIQ